MPKVKIEDTTPGLCTKCSSSQIVRRGHDTIVFCHEFEDPALVHSPVEQCNKFQDKDEPSLYRMEQIALYLITDRQNKIGFVRKKELSTSQEMDLDE